MTGRVDSGARRGGGSSRLATRFERALPGWAWMRRYQTPWWTRDLFAGFTLTAILVPAGMGYAQAAGLPVIYGLYASMTPLLVYALLGPSRILVLGPDSSLAALIAASIVPLAAGSPDKMLALAAMLAILSGVLCLLAGLAKFGFITDLLSNPIRLGYLNGIALTVLVGQLPQFFGFSVAGDKLWREAHSLIRGLHDGQINWWACGIGSSCLVLIGACKRWMPRLPGVLLAVVGAGCLAWLLPLSTEAGLPVVGPLPAGLPRLQLPAVSLDEALALLAAAAAIAMVSFADMSALSRTYALRSGTPVDSNQELIALGAANVAAGLFQGFAVSSSTSRTPVAEAAGAQTQLTGVVGALCIALILILAPGLLQTLPYAALSAVVIAACWSLVDLRGMARLYRLRRSEFALSVVCLLGVALLGVVQGIFMAIGLALAIFIWRAWRPHSAVLGRVEGMKGYHDIARHPQAHLIDGLLIFRWDAPLFFANAEVFEERVLNALAQAPTPCKWLVVAAEPITDIDTTAADMLAKLDQTLHAGGMDLYFAEMKDPVKDLLKRYGLYEVLGSENFFATIGQAVSRYREVEGMTTNN